MAFVTLDNIKNLIPGWLSKEFNAKPDLFNNLELEAGKTVTDITAVASPADVEDAPVWATQPMAFIMTKLAMPMIPSLNEFQIKQINIDYNWAVTFLEGQKAKGTDTATVWSTTGTLDNLTEI